MANRRFQQFMFSFNHAPVYLEANCVIDSASLPIVAPPIPSALSSFAVLASSTITNTGSSVLTGDLGLSPGTSVTGFPPGTVSGTQHITDSQAAAAQVALTTAYTDLAGRAMTSDLSGQNLGGKNLSAGVYKFSTSAQLTGTLTLTGSATDIFVFQIGSTLTTASSASVVLAGGALASNVFWQVGSSATLGTSTTFVGTILAQASITVTTSCNVTGGLFARTGAVTLDTNAVVAVPSPTAPVVVTGAGTRSLKGSGIKSIDRVAIGIYKVSLEDTYARYLGGSAGFVSSVTGNTAMGSLTPGQVYIIRTLGSSTQAQWEAAGVPAGVPAIPGLAFVASAVGAGSGSCFSPVASGIESVEIMGDPNLSVTAVADPHFFIRTLGATSSSDTTMVPKAPADNAVLGLTIMLRNSSVKGKGE